MDNADNVVAPFLALQHLHGATVLSAQDQLIG